MIRVTIEMVPKGDESKAFTMAQGIIANDGTGSVEHGNYIYGLSGQAHRRGDQPDIKRSGRIEGFARTHRDVWELLKEALNSGNQALIARDGTGYQREAK